MNQNYSNHVRKHPLYHYVTLPLSLAAIVASVVCLVGALTLANWILVALSVLLHLAVFLTRDYAKKNQDRIVRLELRLRYFQLTSMSFEEHEQRLSLSQLLALRFASDTEFLQMLTDPAVTNKSGDEIKREIKLWRADLMRV